MPIGTPSRQYVRPPVLKDFNAQGNFFFRPRILFFEDISIQGLQDQLEQEVDAQGGNPTIYYVVKDIQYQVTTRGNQTKYSIMVHLETAENL